jgi:putative membrane protein
MRRGLWNNAAVVILPSWESPVIENSNRARDHLANERTFLAWVRTSVAIVVFGFAIGRFAIAMRQLTEFQGRGSRTTGFSVWMGMSAILAGVALMVAGLGRYRKTRAQLDEGKFEPAGFIVDLVAIVTVLFGLALAGYLIYVQKSLS